MLTKAFIPYKGYYSSPFSKWQGSMANEHSIVLGSETAKNWLDTKEIRPDVFDYLILGATVGQPHMFYGGSWAAALIGAENISGVLINQACSTSTTVIFQAAIGIETGLYQNVFTLMTDRCSNGPHTIWPNPKGPGGQVISENWVMDQFNNDPWAKNAMIQTAENVAKETGVTREQCDEVALRRSEQYSDALTNDREFQKKYMFQVSIKVSKKKAIQIEADEGIMPTTKEGLESLRPILPDGSHTFGSQTHPADGNCALIVTTKEKASEISQDKSKDAQIISYGFSRAKKGFMAMAVVPAAQMALDKAGISIKGVKVIKTHNPFAANDIYLANQMNIDVNGFNNFGSSLIFGHPQAPTAGRLIIEGIEELADLGGGYMLFTGCAAGDTGAAIVLKIGD
ncbi:MAG: thiolase family protein [Desulfobacterales bacterium]|nr:thiolase family protein [Desulfobacterales bacterium]